LLDVEFLLAPAFGRRTVYRYRSGVLRPEVRRGLEAFAVASNHLSYRHLSDDFAAALSGLFMGLHWADLSGAKLSVIENAMQAMSHHEDGPVAIFLPASSSVFKSVTWSELEQKATVIDEPLISPRTLDAVVRYALSKSDLSPPTDLHASKAFRSYLQDRLEITSDLRDILGDIDDYVLTRVDRVQVPSTEVAQRVPETSLIQALRTFLRNPDPAETRKLLHQTLLRGDDERLAIGALSAVTSTLLRQSGGAREDAEFGKFDEALLVWTSALLTTQVNVAQMRIGYAPSWRSQPDLRAFGIMELCRDYRVARQDPERRRWLIGRAGRAIERAGMLSEVDERAFERVRSEAIKYLQTFSATPKWCADLTMVLEPKLHTSTPAPMQFRPTLDSIWGQPAVVEHLRRRVIAGSLNDSVLFYGPVSGARMRVASAYAKAAMCESPINGDACGRCQRCHALESTSSANDIVVRLEGANAPQGGAEWEPLAETQVRQVRDAIFTKSLWSGRRVVVLDGVDRVRKGALDGLLKAIEASPDEVSFVFVAERLNGVPAALRSRSSVFKIKPTALR
jgi:cytochrome c553